MNTLIEHFGLYFSEVGLNKTYGRLFGVFLLATKPLSMMDLVEQLSISKSTASVELRRLLTMGVIEKTAIPGERVEYYQLKQNIWLGNLKQKIEDIQRLRSIITKVPSKKIKDHPNLVEMEQYCIFMEEELERLVKKYSRIVK